MIGEDGKSRSGLINAEGRYEIQDAPLGDVKVIVVSYEAPPEVKGIRRLSIDAPKAGQMMVVSKQKLAIPEKYTRPESSGLMFKISSGSQSIPIDLK